MVYKQGSKKYSISFYKNLSDQQLYSELIGLLNSILERQNEESDYLHSNFNNHEEFLTYINKIKSKLKSNNKTTLENLELDFLPTSTFQELSISNDWSKDYLKLSKRFDLIHQVLTNRA
ncbi:hypothetical protein [uncultured Winogradskyella sp.]|uniref:hypothetical protein n=1 Tax=uncultured Winogradskyella sp. TaxID=395353 RepID=UPI00261072C8|nr:hypothetical protein [uncultured Winogradskyella sp.]